MQFVLSKAQRFLARMKEVWLSEKLTTLFCGIFFALAFSFTGLILTSHIQIGSLTQTTETLEATDDLDEKACQSGYG